MTLVAATGITIRYTEQVLSLPDITMVAGQHTLLLGASGAGKTSLLLCLAGLLSPASGTVCLNGQNIYALPESQRDAFRAAHLGIVFQTLHLLPDLTALQNILLGSSESSYATSRLSPLSDALGITELLHRKPRQLSQGQAQRVAIARALIGKPLLLLADEPTAALDDANAAAVISLLRDVAAQHGTTLLIATHDARLKGQGFHEVTLS